MSKRLRYEVLRRCSYSCYYCGAKPPIVELVVDAVNPEALGGSHKDASNLVAACVPCNTGKSSSTPEPALLSRVAEEARAWESRSDPAILPNDASLFARRTLKLISAEQRKEAWESAREALGDLATPRDALEIAISSTEAQREFLQASLTELLEAMPGGSEMLEAERDSEREIGDGTVDHSAVAVRVAWQMVTRCRQQAAAAFLGMLSADERDIWLARAREQPKDWYSDSDEIIAADLAREALYRAVTA